MIEEDIRRQAELVVRLRHVYRVAEGLLERARKAGGEQDSELAEQVEACLADFTEAEARLRRMTADVPSTFDR